MSLRPTFVLIAAAALAACSSEPAKAPEPPAVPAEIENAAPLEVENAGAPVESNAVAVADATPAAFAQCAACHSVVKGGAAMIGPDLWGAAGSKAASRPGFAYSAQLKAAGLTWDAVTLDKWLTKPAALVPGTKMAFPGQPDASKRQAIIAYLETLR